MEDVIYTLLKLARLDAGIIQMEKNEENLSVLMQDVMERFETWAEQDHKQIVLSGGSDVTLACDALWMSEASEISLRMRWNIHVRVVTFPCSGHDRRS